MIPLPADLNHDRAAAFAGTIASQLAAQAGPVVVDAGNMKVFDSSALAVLLECRRQALAAGRPFTVQALPPKLRQLAGLYGVEELLPAAEATQG